MEAAIKALKVGTEHEFSINDRDFRPMPINDMVIERLYGSIPNEISFGGIGISKELQKHALEFKPSGPHTSLRALEKRLQRGLRRFVEALGGEIRVLGLGMHPLLTLDMTTYWDHEEREVYETYDRVFGIWQHGWLNIQALQVNLPYRGPVDMVRKYNRLRALIPYLVAMTASSPYVEGRSTGLMDNRLHFYRENQRRVPLICNGVIPERLTTAKDYDRSQQEVYRQLRELGADVLCHEWVNSGGIIVRPTRKCLEIKAMDEQECLHADIAISALIRALLRPRELPLEEDRDALISLLRSAMEKGTEALRPELEKVLDMAIPFFQKEDRSYLPYLRRRIRGGSLAEVILKRHGKDAELRPMLEALEECLLQNRPYYGPQP